MIYVGSTAHPEHKELGRVFKVGRPSILGNPFSHKVSKYPVTMMATPEIAVHGFKVWLWEKMKEKDVPVMNELHLIKKAADEGDVVLMCWCVDEYRNGVCHAFIIKSAVEWMLNGGKV